MIIIASVLVVVLLIVGGYTAKRLYNHLKSEKGENDESLWDMLVALGIRVHGCIEDNRDYFKVILNFLQITTTE